MNRFVANLWVSRSLDILVNDRADTVALLRGRTIKKIREIIVDSIWKKPARLWRRRAPIVAGAAPPDPQALAAGSLEDMVLRAIARGAAAAEEREALFIDLEAKQLFAWGDISELHRSPEFPVEI